MKGYKSASEYGEKEDRHAVQGMGHLPKRTEDVDEYSTCGRSGIAHLSDLEGANYTSQL